MPITSSPPIKIERPGFQRGSSSITDHCLLPSDLDYFAQFRIPPELLYENRIHRGKDAWIRAEYGITWEPARDVSGIVFPYFHPATGYLVNVRVRRDRPEIAKDGKQRNKYICPPRNSQHLYFLLTQQAKLHNPKVPAVIVEAEKSVLVLAAWADRMGWEILPLGIGGCWGWHGKRARSWLAPNGEWQRIPGPVGDLTYLNDRTVYIMLDSNATTNPDVQWARTELIVELNKAYRNCMVRVCDLPMALE